MGNAPVQTNIDTLLGNQGSDTLHSASALTSLINTEHNQNAFTHTLTLFGQALTPYIVREVLNKLSDVFEPSSLAFHHLSGVFGDDVIEIRGHSNSRDHIHINQLLSDVTQRFNVDAGIQKDRPSLSTPGLLVMDMDSTVIAIECIDEIAKLADVGDQVAEVTAKAMRGEIAFNDSLIHRVACLEGVPLEHLTTIRDSIPIMPGIQTLVAQLKQYGWKLAIASGGFTYFANYLKDRLGLDYAISNTLAIDNDTLTGKVEGEIVNAQVKARTVDMLTEEWQIASSQTVAMGDGANDLDMMAHAALGVACHGKPLVNEKADVAIRVGGLHSMLYFLDR